MSDGWNQDRDLLRLAFTRFAVVVYYRPMSHLWRFVQRKKG